MSYVFVFAKPARASELNFGSWSFRKTVVNVVNVIRVNFLNATKTVNVVNVIRHGFPIAPVNVVNVEINIHPNIHPKFLNKIKTLVNVTSVVNVFPNLLLRARAHPPA